MAGIWISIKVNDAAQLQYNLMFIDIFKIVIIICSLTEE